MTLSQFFDIFVQKDGCVQWNPFLFLDFIEKWRMRFWVQGPMCL